MFAKNTTESTIDYIKNHTPDSIIVMTNLYVQFSCFIFLVYATFITVPITLLLNNKYVTSPLKSITGQSKIEEDEASLNTIQQEANAKITSIMKEHPSELIYMVEHPARCLDHALNGNNPVGKKEEILVFANDSTHPISVCSRSEVKPEIYYNKKTPKVVGFINFIYKFFPSSDLYYYHNIVLDIVSDIVHLLFAASFLGLENFFESILPHHNAIDTAQLKAVKLIASSKKYLELDLYLVQNPGKCADGDNTVRSFRDEDTTNIWLVCAGGNNDMTSVTDN